MALFANAGFHEQEKGTRRLLSRKKYKRRRGETGREKCSIIETDIFEDVNLIIIQNFIIQKFIIRKETYYQQILKKYAFYFDFISVIFDDNN